MKLVKSLFKMLNISDKYVEINDTLDNYAAIHGVIANGINQYKVDVEKVAKENELKFSERSSEMNFETKEHKKLFRNIEALMLTGIKEKYLEMQEFGLVVDNIMDTFSKRDGEEKVFSIFGHKLTKHSIVEFNEFMLKDTNVELVEFPEQKNDDIALYAKKMDALLFDIQKAKENIDHCENIIRELKAGDPLHHIFNQMKEINVSNLSTFELDYLKEVKFTKNMLDKTLNFIQPPFDINKETVAIHAYLRKLVDTGILDSAFFYKRFTQTIPDCLQPFKEELGFFIIEEELAAKQQKEKEQEQQTEAVA